MPESLWGDLPKASLITPPISILREQAGVLANATNNVLVGEVELVKKDNKVLIYFYVVAPALDNYKVGLFRVRHDVLLYPVEIVDWIGGNEYSAENEDEFKNILKDILSSAAVHRIIGSLRSQSVSGEEANT